MKATDIKQQVSVERLFVHYGTPKSKTHFGCLFPENHHNGDATPSVSVKNERATCQSQGCLKGDDIFSIVGKKQGLSTFKEQRDYLINTFCLNGNQDNRRPPILRSYQWTDAKGRKRYHLRMSAGSKFLWNSKPDGTGTGKLSPCHPDLYQRENVLKAKRVIVCAGERDTETINRWLRELGLFGECCATTNHTGENAVKAESFAILDGKDAVYVLGDNDKTGGSFRAKVLKILDGKIGTLFSVYGPGPWNDITDWAEDGGTPDQFKALLETAQLYQGTLEHEATEAKDDNAIPVKDEGLIKEMADRILEENAFARDVGGSLYHFKGGVYLPNGEHVIAVAFQRILEIEKRTKQWTSHNAREIYTYISTGAPELWSRPPLDVINVQNGLLRLGRLPELLPHSSQHLCSIQMPVLFDPQATCPAWEQFIQDVIPEDTHGLLWELIAHLMVPDISFQKSFLFLGEGANGKSTLLHAIINFLGKTNVCSLTLQRLEADKFAAARLVGKLASICADLPSAHLTSSSMFKAIVGGDDIEAERKFKDSFLFSPFARLLFSANHFPESKDSSEAFFRRWLVIPFERTFAPSEQVSPHILDARLADTQELSGVLSRALAVLPQLQARGRFSECESTKGAWMEFREQTDPVANWLDLHTIEHPEAKVSRGELHKLYTKWAYHHGRPNISQKSFMQSVRRLRPRVQEGQRRIGGKVEWAFLGLGLKTDPLPDSVSHLSHHSHHPPQISLSSAGEGEERKDEGERSEKNLNRENGVTDVTRSDPRKESADVSSQNIKDFGDSVSQRNHEDDPQEAGKWCDYGVTPPSDGDLFDPQEVPYIDY